jgi:membrane-associated phospholipid phosphatase
MWWTCARGGWMLTLATGVRWLRVYAGEHTPHEVLVGALVGLTSAELARSVLRPSLSVT